MAKILLANGCSHVAGSESPISFAEPLAEKMGMTSVNIATPGGGNDRILRTTIDYCVANPVDFVVIGWTTHERMEITFRDEWQCFGLGRQVHKSTDLHDDEYVERLQQLFDFMSLNCCTWYPHGVEKTLVYQISLQSFLEARGIDYIFFNAWNLIPQVGDSQGMYWASSNYVEKCNQSRSEPAYKWFNENSYQHPKWDAINKDKYYKPHNALFKDYEDLMPEHFSEMHHGNEHVHNAIAEELYERINRTK
jgi:hypothetical protein